MGYTTDFTGNFTVTPALEPAQVEYLKAFSDTRRMARNAVVTAARPDPKREAVGLPIGDQGGYFVGAGGCAGQEDSRDMSGLGILDYNSPPYGQPGLWCQWVPNDEGTKISWDGGEKFYDYVAWLSYIVKHFLKPWGRALNGEVQWSGEEDDDLGKIIARDNVITTATVVIAYAAEQEED